MPMDWSLVRRRNGTGVGLPPGWTWTSGPPANMSNEFKAFIAVNLEKLPNDVIRVEEANRFVSVYWNERGDVDAVNAIIDFVKRCTEIVPYTTDNTDS